MYRRIALAVLLSLQVSHGAADIRTLDLSTTFGWEVENADQDVDRALSVGDSTFFASGGIACSPLEVPPEFMHLATSTHTIYCGCTVSAKDDEEANRMRQQFDYAHAYNRALLARLTAGSDFYSAESISRLLPSESDIQTAVQSVQKLENRTLQSGALGSAFVDTEAGRHWNQEFTRKFGPDLGPQYEKLGMYGVGFGGWRSEAVRFPEDIQSYQELLDGQPITITAIDSVPDATLPGAHITLVLENENRLGWARLTVADGDELAVAGTFYMGDKVYRIITSPDYRTQIMLRVSDSRNPEVQRQILSAVAISARISEVEARHQQIERMRTGLP